MFCPFFATPFSEAAAVSDSSEPIYLYDLSRSRCDGAKDSRAVLNCWDEAHAVATAQGIVNREKPRLYLRYVEAGGQNIDDYWLKYLRRPGGWLADRPVVRIDSLEDLIKQFHKDIRGVVLYDPKVPATSNLASTISGIENLIAVRCDPRLQSIYSRIVLAGPKLPVRVRLLRENGQRLFTGKGMIPDTDIPSTGSAKCDAYVWAVEKYLNTGKCDGAFLAYYIDAFWQTCWNRSNAQNHTLTNHDFFVSRRAFFFDLSCWGDEAPNDDPGQPLGTDRRTFQRILLSAYNHGGRERMIHIGGFTPWAYKYTTKTGGKHGGVPTEWETGLLVSAYNGFVDADALGLSAMANASFFQHFPLRARYAQPPWPTEEELRDKGFIDANGNVVTKNRMYAMIYTGDYDSAAWFYQTMPHMWNDPQRGHAPISWAFSPILTRRAPMVMDYVRRTATPNDCFIAADNGAGYLMPAFLEEPRPFSGLPSGLDAWERHCGKFYERLDLKITGFIIDAHGRGMSQRSLEAYARFSPGGVVPQKIPLMLLYKNMPVLQSGPDLSGSPAHAAKTIEEWLPRRKRPFQWYRTILQTPAWHVALQKTVTSAHPEFTFVDAQTFFALLKRYLERHSDISKNALVRVPQKH